MAAKIESASEISILYVEDDLETRETLSAILARIVSTLPLYVAENGEAGLELYRKHRQDIVITDINMPEMDGIRMAFEMKQLDPEVVIIALTARCDFRKLPEFIDAEFSSVVSKPVVFAHLLDEIAKCIGTVTMRNRLKAKADYAC